MKSGTTSLHHMLNQHPEIFMSEYKEPEYFAGDQCYQHSVWFDGGPLPDPDGRWYFQLFEKTHENPQLKYAGESSAVYAQRPVINGCAERIAAFNPDARIIYIMRDPLERAISHYWHNVRGREKETRPPIEVVRQDPRLIACSDYAFQLEPYFKVFPKEQIHVLTLESLRDNPAATLRSIYEWLGVDTEVPTAKTSKSNSKPEDNRQARPLLRGVARLRHSRRWRAATKFLPKKFHNALYVLSHRQVPENEYDFQEVTDYLRPILSAKVGELSALLGREFPEWKTTLPVPRPLTV